MNTAADSTKSLSPTKRALLALKEMQAKLEATERAKREPIAIIGMGCRLPGGAASPDAYWDLLINQRDAITEVPGDRWDVDAYYDPDPETPGKIYTRYGSFVDDVDRFDPAFFSISPREALTMDPQQRLLLEVTWEALEQANQVPDRLFNSPTGVFVGICTNDYTKVALGPSAQSGETIDAYFATGNSHSVASGRLSYIFGFTGPSLAVDTACSSSLVSVHLACQSLRLGECTLALAAGVNLLLSPQTTMTFSKAKMMAPDGRCKTFDAAANGYVRGEGCGVVVLKRLSEALADGDNILAVIRGSAVNQDGPSGGLTVPNGPSQEKVLRQALQNGSVNPAEVAYIEAHGTGTSLGDPIEVEALGTVFGPHRPVEQPLRIGSVKTNIGHLEAAAGIAGLIKVVLSLNHELIPPHLHFREPNPYINWSQWPIEVTAAATPWPRGEKPRLAGVSSFGFSGTNAHILLEEAPAAPVVPEVTSDRPQHLLTLSAKSAPALEQLAQRYQTFLRQAENAQRFAAICYTANTQRSVFEHRLSLVAATAPEAADQLLAFSTNADDSRVISGRTTGTLTPGTAFLFTGQGSQYSGMGHQLYQSQPVFRQALEACDAKLQPLLGISLIDLLFDAAQAETLNQTAFTQPALFALEYALAQLWLSWGVRPAVVMGHSVGEYVAACIAGVFSLDDGLKLIAERGRLMQALPTGGGMVSILASQATVQEYLAPYADRVAFAAINGPASVVISGPNSALETVVSKLEQASIKAKPLVVSHAFHSPLMEPMLAEFERVARQVQYQSPSLKLISNLTGRLAGEEIATAEYWCRHIRQPVLFAAGLQTLHQLGFKTFLELGPKPVLLGMGRQCLPLAADQRWLPSLRPPLADWSVLLESLGQLYVQGTSIDWASFEQGYARQRLSLPTYAFQRQRYWVEAEAQLSPVSPVVSRPVASDAHPLLGNRLRSALKVLQFESILRADSPDFLTDHQVAGTVVLPATAYCEIALAAGTAVNSAGRTSLESIAIHQPLVLTRELSTVVHCVLTSVAETTYRFEIFSLPTSGAEASIATEEVWTLHAEGMLLTAAEPGETVTTSVPTLPSTSIDGTLLYQQFHRQGLNYGPAFQGVQQVWRTETEIVGKIQLPEHLVTDADRYRLHPALLDACFQILGVTADESETRSLYLPVAVGKLQIHQPVIPNLWCRAENLRSESNQQVLRTDLVLFDNSGTVLAQVTDLTLRRVNRQALMRSLQPQLDDWLYRLDWRSLEAAIPTQQLGPEDSWLIFADESDTAEALVKQLEAAGANCLQVLQGITYRQIDPHKLEVNPANPEDFQRLISEGLASGLAYKGIVYLWSATATPDLTEEQVVRSQPAICGGALHLVQALAQASPTVAPQLWLISRGTQTVAGVAPTQPQAGSLWGLGRVLMLEHPDLRCRCLDLDPEPGATDSQHILAEIIANGPETQLAYRQNQRYGARLVRYQAPALDSATGLTIPQSPYQVRISEYGVLENLRLVPTERRLPGPDEVEIEVRAVGLNFRDVLNALGMMKSITEAMGVTDTAEVPFGGECAGVITAVGVNVQHLAVGDEVIAAQALGSLSSHVVVSGAFVIPKPAALSYEAAATIPTAFLTAYHALHHQAQLKSGERILIHAAAGGVGQAAVQVAQWLGAEVWGTASEPKWPVLKDMGVTQVFNSRTLEFAEQITALTSDNGVNVVLNSLNGDFIPKTLSVLGAQGRFVEIGKLGIWSAEQMAEVRPDVAYLPFDLLDISLKTPEHIGRWLQDLMPLFEQGALNPLPHRIFPIEQMVEAFRFMAQAKHIGKVVISLPTESHGLSQGATPAESRAIHSQGTYLVTGGLGALGQQVARWLAQQGAQHIVLTGRRVPSEVPVLVELAQQGVTVQALAADVSQQAAIADLVKQIQTTLPPLKGVFHVAGVLDDGMIAGQTWEQFERVMAPKVAGAWWLHEQTKGENLDYFVCFSSLAAVVGSPGQANYAAANAFMDALASYRQGLGLPGLSINWGPWSQSGMAAALQSRDQARWAAQGVSLIEPHQGIALLTQLVATAQRSQAIALPVDWTRYLAQIPPEMTPPLLEFVAQDYASAGAKVASFLPELEAATPSQRKPLLLHHVQSNLARVLGLSAPEELDPQQGLADLGMDSLMAVELRNRLQSSLGCPVPTTVVFDYPTITALVDYLAEVLHLDTDAPEDSDLPPLASDPPEALPTGTATDDLSDSEAEALLLEKLDSMRY
ncbi:beta-ketoacyl synthase [filamentous cyanobacterium CCP3]|nr:beta-ketoacyl synthase [filamentous cyanobacterium CCP3]